MTEQSEIAEDVFGWLMEPDRQRSCEGKVKHETEWQAASEAKEKGLSWYRCRWCGGWHLTSR